MRASSSLSHKFLNKPPVVCGACSQACFAKVMTDIVIVVVMKQMQLLSVSQLAQVI